MKLSSFRSIGMACGALLMLAMASVSFGQNLLTDPGFELQTSAPNPNPTGIPGWGTFGGAGFSNSAVPPHSGSWVMDMNGAPGGYYVPGAFEEVDATAGLTYTLSGWVYTPNALATGSNDFAILQLQFYSTGAPSGYGGTANGPAVGVNVGTPAGGGGVPLPQGVWTYASVTATAPAGTQSVSAFLLNINADANAHFDFDDTSLTVPEPASVGLLAIGGLAALRRKR